MFRNAGLLTFRLAAPTAFAGCAFYLGRHLVMGGCPVCVPKAVLVLGDHVVPLSWFGLGGAMLLLALSPWTGGLAARFRMGLALTGGGAALALVLVQVSHMAGLCPTCCVIDGAFLAAAVTEAIRKPAPRAAIRRGA